MQEVDGKHGKNHVSAIENIEIRLRRLYTMAPAIRKLLVMEHISGMVEACEELNGPL